MTLEREKERERVCVVDNSKGSETLTLDESSEKRGKFTLVMGSENSDLAKREGNNKLAIRRELFFEKVKRNIKKKDSLLMRERFIHNIFYIKNPMQIFLVFLCYKIIMVYCP
jgi:hypothetical protein